MDNLLLVLFLCIYLISGLLIGLNPLVGLLSFLILLLFLTLGIVIPAKIFKDTDGCWFLIGMMGAIILYIQLMFQLDNYSEIYSFLGINSTLIGVALLIIEGIGFMYAVEQVAKMFYANKQRKKK